MIFDPSDLRTYTPGEIIENPVYRPQQIPSYRQHPYIEALPPILLPEQVIELIEYRPDYDQSQRHLPAHLRLHLIYDAVEFFQPLPAHFELEERISRLIRQGYKRRNPLDIAQMAALREAARTMHVDVAAKRSPVSLSGLGFAIIGTSGTGKTTALNAVLSLYPQVIRHTYYGNRDFIRQQIVFLRLECPQDGSLRGLCFSFFKAVDDLCETREYTGHARNGRATADEMIPAMANVVRKYGIGLLVIDEVQNLSEARSGGAKSLLNFFVRLANEMGLPIILVGTPKVRHILGQELRQARRAAGQGDMTWERLEELELDESGDDEAMGEDEASAWQLFTDSLWQYQYVQQESPLTPALRHALYEESQGIVDFAVKIYMLAQVRAIATGQERVTEGIIQAVAKDSLQLARPMLTALRERDIHKLALIDDIDPIDIAAYIDEAKRAIRDKAAKRGNKQQDQEDQDQDRETAAGMERDETAAGMERDEAAAGMGQDETAAGMGQDETAAGMEQGKGNARGTSHDGRAKRREPSRQDADKPSGQAGGEIVIQPATEYLSVPEGPPAC